jgi:transcription elongation factor Elf1
MRIPFVCPSCAKAGSVDASAAGRQARCKHCGYGFTVPSPSESELEDYSLEEPDERTDVVTAISPPAASTFVPSHGDDSTTPRREPKRREPESVRLMRIPFVCPSCARAGSVDASAAGRPARCKQCGCDFTIPRPVDDELAGYALEEPDERTDAVTAFDPPAASSFVRSRGDDATAPPRNPKRRPPESTTRTTRERSSHFPWGTRLVQGGVAIAIVLAAIAFLAPRGMLIAGCALMALGSLMVLLGFGAGAYGAFHEDSLYGFLYLVIPLYTAYYMITRWDDLWVWFVCSTAGVGLVVLGTEMIQWGGVTV